MGNTTHLGKLALPALLKHCPLACICFVDWMGIAYSQIAVYSMGIFWHKAEEKAQWKGTHIGGCTQLFLSAEPETHRLLKPFVRMQARSSLFPFSAPESSCTFVIVCVYACAFCLKNEERGKSLLSCILLFHKNSTEIKHGWDCGFTNLGHGFGSEQGCGMWICD